MSEVPCGGYDQQPVETGKKPRKRGLKMPTFPEGVKLSPVPYREIRGMNVPCRALEIALTGNHSIIFAGYAHSGKSTMRAAALELREQIPGCHVVTGVIDACLCSPSSFTQCRCPENVKRRYARKFLRCQEDFDICVECAPATRYELMGPATKRTDHIVRWITEGREFLAGLPAELPLDGSGSGARTLEMAIRRLQLSTDRVKRILSVSRTIAGLRRRKEIQASDIAEATQYRVVEMPR